MEPLEIRRSWFPFVSTLLVAASGVSWAVHDLREGDLAQAIIALVAMVVATAMLLRLAATPFVRIRPEGITYYGDIRTRSVEWCSIERVELNRSYQMMVLPRDARPMYLPLSQISRSQREVLLRVMKQRLEGSLTSASS